MRKEEGGRRKAVGGRRPSGCPPSFRLPPSSFLLFRAHPMRARLCRFEPVLTSSLNNTQPSRNGLNP